MDAFDPMNTNIDPRLDPTRSIRAPRGTTLSCKNWITEAAYRMLQNNLDDEVAENPKHLVVYGGIGRAARDWACYDQILSSLRELDDDETLLVQSGKPVGVFKTHANAPRVLIANSNLVPKWSNWAHFNELDRKGLFMYGQMTAGSWIYIGSQGIVQGTFETFVEAGRQHHGNDWSGRWILTAGLGGMGGAQPLAATLAGAVSLHIECQQSSIDFRLRTRYVDKQARDIDEALALVRYANSCIQKQLNKCVATQRRRVLPRDSIDHVEGRIRITRHSADDLDILRKRIAPPGYKNGKCLLAFGMAAPATPTLTSAMAMAATPRSRRPRRVDGPREFLTVLFMKTTDSISIHRPGVFCSCKITSAWPWPAAPGRKPAAARP